MKAIPQPSLKWPGFQITSNMPIRVSAIPPPRRHEICSLSISTDNSVVNVLGAKGNKNDVAPTGMYDPFTEIYAGGTGTEEYKHSWNLFDQVIISGSFLQNKNHKLHYDKAEIFKPDFIIDKYKGHEGEPTRSFVGTHWINGYSDHFPVILYLAR